MKLLKQFGERMLAWTIILAIGVVVALVAQLLGH
jgi:hypothetical protein